MSKDISAVFERRYGEEKMIMRKYVIVTCLIVFVTSTVFCFKEKTEVRAKEKPLVLVLDPGHGGSQSGAARDNEKVEEKDLN